MILHDLSNAPVYLPSRKALTAWNGVIQGFLSHGTQTPVHLEAALALAPDFALGHAARGLFCMMMGRAELVATAQKALQAAQAAPQPDTRSIEWVQALAAWLGGHPTVAISAMETVLKEHPYDTLSAKVSHAIRFILGDINGMRSSIERIVDAHHDHPLRGYVLGCHAFALEEAGEYSAAERTGREGLQYASDDAWGLHAVAHVYDMTGRPAGGIGLIRDHQAAWDHCNNFRTHVWWHKALLHLDLGEIDHVFDLYDREIRAEKTDDYRDIANATSLLMRLELDGHDVGSRWEEIAMLAANRVDDGCLVFADLHYMLALSGAGRTQENASMLARAAVSARAPGDMNARAAHPGLAAMRGLSAFCEQRWSDAFDNLAQARTGMQSIGGSHTQRDVFERMTIDAGLRAGQFAHVAQILAQRTAQRAGREDRFAASRRAIITKADLITLEAAAG